MSDAVKFSGAQVASDAWVEGVESPEFKTLIDTKQRLDRAYDRYLRCWLFGLVSTSRLRPGYPWHEGTGSSQSRLRAYCRQLCHVVGTCRRLRPGVGKSSRSSGQGGGR